MRLAYDFADSVGDFLASFHLECSQDINVGESLQCCNYEARERASWQPSCVSISGAGCGAGCGASCGGNDLPRVGF